MKAALTFLFVLSAIVGALAQEYPTHNVTFIVPTGPGAATDLLARILAPQLGERSANHSSWKTGRAPAR